MGRRKTAGGGPPGVTSVEFAATNSAGLVSAAHLNFTVTFDGTFFLLPIRTDGTSVLNL